MPEVFPVYQASQPIYGEQGSVCFPLALMRKVGEAKDARLLRNAATGKEVWIPNDVFAFHWHVLSATEMQLFLIVSDVWGKKL